MISILTFVIGFIVGMYVAYKIHRKISNEVISRFTKILADTSATFPAAGLMISKALDEAARGFKCQR